MNRSESARKRVAGGDRVGVVGKERVAGTDRFGAECYGTDRFGRSGKTRSGLIRIDVAGEVGLGRVMTDR